VCAELPINFSLSSYQEFEVNALLNRQGGQQTWTPSLGAGVRRKVGEEVKVSKSKVKVQGDTFLSSPCMLLSLQGSPFHWNGIPVL